MMMMMCPQCPIYSCVVAAVLYILACIVSQCPVYLIFAYTVSVPLFAGPVPAVSIYASVQCPPCETPPWYLSMGGATNTDAAKPPSTANTNVHVNKTSSMSPTAFKYDVSDSILRRIR